MRIRSLKDTTKFTNSTNVFETEETDRSSSDVIIFALLYLENFHVKLKILSWICINSVQNKNNSNIDGLMER